MRIYCRHGDRRYVATLSIATARKYDNGRLVSCGLSIPDDVSASTFTRWIARGIAVECAADEYNHSGCLSRCVRRGDSKCQW